MIKPSVDYRQFRFSKLNTPEFSHVWLLLYWPLFGLGFSYVERFYPVAHYIEMHCALDDLIPFNESPTCSGSSTSSARGPTRSFSTCRAFAA